MVMDRFGVEMPISPNGHWKNKRVGILGGSFNPAHEGHVHISQIALEALGLDTVWWMVTPQNPLKSEHDLLPMAQRIKLAEQITSDQPNIFVTDIEDKLNSKYSYDSIIGLKKLYPETEFVWIAGMDCAQNFHLWNKWQDILNEIPILYINRYAGTNFKEIEQLPVMKLPTQKNIMLDNSNFEHPPALDSNLTYWLLDNEIANISSTEIRKISV